jgi:hypothetical protein
MHGANGMGLTANNLASGNPGRLFGAAQGAFSSGMMSIIQNAACFVPGGITSIPQGYNNQNAIRMTVKTGGMISARFRADLNATASLIGIGSIAAIIAAESYFTANGNVAINGYATFIGEFGIISDISAIGNMSANMDLLARPSANDIAQEIWNSKVAAFQSTGTLGKSLSSAESAAKLGAALSA